MHGNLWEWTQDRYGVYPSGADGSTDPNSSRRVFRGGGWYTQAKNCRSAFRIKDAPLYTDNDYGFRLALSSFGFPGSAEPSEKKESR